MKTKNTWTYTANDLWPENAPVSPQNTENKVEVVPDYKKAAERALDALNGILDKWEIDYYGVESLFEGRRNVIEARAAITELEGLLK